MLSGHSLISRFLHAAARHHFPLTYSTPIVGRRAAQFWLSNLNNFTKIYLFPSTKTTTRLDSPSDVMTAEAKAAQPPVPQESQGIMTRSKTSTLGSATLLLPSPPPALNPDGDDFQVEAPQASHTHMDVAIPPEPGEMLSVSGN